MESERNWGLFYPDQTIVYNLDFTGRGSVDVISGANVTSLNGTTWCIASSNSSDSDLQSALNWARGPWNVDCSSVQPSQACFEPDTVVSHASFDLNSYYQQNGATDVACRFGGAGLIVDKNPSYDNCLYLTAGANKTAASNAAAITLTTSSSRAGMILVAAMSPYVVSFLSLFWACISIL